MALTSYSRIQEIGDLKCFFCNSVLANKLYKKRELKTLILEVENVSPVTYWMCKLCRP